MRFVGRGVVFGNRLVFEDTLSYIKLVIEPSKRYVSYPVSQCLYFDNGI